MRIEHIRLQGFRNYESADVEPGRDVTVFVGPNASGKTNMIEAIQAATTTTSFRRPAWEDVVRWGSDSAEIRLGASGASRRVDLLAHITADGKRSFSVNGQTKRRHADVAAHIPAVVFTPDDLRMVKDGAERRRTAMDDLGVRLWPGYADARKRYARAVRQRNLLLKEERVAPSDLEPWTAQVVESGGRLTAYRAHMVARLSGHAARVFGEVTDGEGLGIRYADASGTEGEPPEDGANEWASESLAARLAERSAEERTRRITLAGPHRDDVAVEVDGREARAFASQGQQRSVALAWKLAELALLEESTRRRPVLLLDDVMSELDEARRAALIGVVADDIQTFITTTNLGYFDEDVLGRAKVVEL